MKVIDIMQKVANKEIFKFKIDDINYYVDKSNYICEEDGNKVKWYIDDVWLNMNAEIIEEKEETKPITKESIEALGYACGEIQKCFTNGWNKSLKNEPLIEEDKKIEKLNKMHFHKKQRQLANKINEIIDYINGSDKE